MPDNQIAVTMTSRVSSTIAELAHLLPAVEQARRYGAQVRYAEDYELDTPALGARGCNVARVGARRAWVAFLGQFSQGSLIWDVIRSAFWEEYCR